MKQKLKVHIWRTNSTVHLQVLEQEGIDKHLSSRVRVMCSVYLEDYEIYLRGNNKEDDYLIDNLYLDTEKEAINYIEKVVSWLDDVFPAREPKRGDYVLVKSESYVEPQKRIFLGVITGSASPYICVTENTESNFLRGEKFLHNDWVYMKPISSNWNPETGIYEAEREV